jgi:hypothetical protein
VALAAVKNEEPVAELSAQYEVHTTMFNSWKIALIYSAPNIFTMVKTSGKIEAQADDLYKHIGQLKVEPNDLRCWFSVYNIEGFLKIIDN